MNWLLQVIKKKVPIERPSHLSENRKTWHLYVYNFIVFIPSLSFFLSLDVETWQGGIWWVGVGGYIFTGTMAGWEFRWAGQRKNVCLHVQRQPCMFRFNTTHVMKPIPFKASKTAPCLVSHRFPHHNPKTSPLTIPICPTWDGDKKTFYLCKFSFMPHPFVSSLVSLSLFL